MNSMSQIFPEAARKMEANNGEVASSTAPAIFDAVALNPPQSSRNLREHLVISMHA